MKLDFPAVEALLIPNASRKLYFCTYAAEDGKTEHFGSKSDWKKHEKNFHETGKEYGCPDPSCSQTFSRDYDYYQHCKRHGNLKALPASEMMKELPQKTAFGCGFNHCKMVSYSWDERCNHVADHMKKEGKTPSDWSYSNVIRNLFRQQKQNIREISKIIIDQFRYQKKIDRSWLSWSPNNTRELRQNLECGIFYPNVEVFVQKAVELSSLSASKSPNQAIVLPNRYTIPSQDSVQSADTSSMSQIQDFPMADSTDFDGFTQFDPSQLASQLQLPFENQPQLSSPHNMDFSISYNPNYGHNPDSFYRIHSEFGYPNIDPMLTKDSFSQPSQIPAESNLDSQLQYRQDNLPEYSNQEQHMHPLERYYEPLPQPHTNPGRFIMNGLKKMNSNLSSKKPQHFQLAANSEEIVPSLPMYSRTAALGFNSVTDSFYPGNHNEEVTDLDDGAYKPWWMVSRHLDVIRCNGGNPEFSWSVVLSAYSPDYVLIPNLLYIIDPVSPSWFLLPTPRPIVYKPLFLHQCLITPYGLSDTLIFFFAQLMCKVLLLLFYFYPWMNAPMYYYYYYYFAK